MSMLVKAAALVCGVSSGQRGVADAANCSTVTASHICAPCRAADQPMSQLLSPRRLSSSCRVSRAAEAESVVVSIAERRH